MGEPSVKMSHPGSYRFGEQHANFFGKVWALPAPDEVEGAELCRASFFGKVCCGRS
jgi:hypothetical protein